LKPWKRYKLPIQIVVRRSRPSMKSFTTDIDYITTPIIHSTVWADARIRRESRIQLEIANEQESSGPGTA
jgi:hypothetical protein